MKLSTILKSKFSRTLIFSLIVYPLQVTYAADHPNGPPPQVELLPGEIDAGPDPMQIFYMNDLLQVGQEAPDFSLADPRGEKTVSLSDLKALGRPIVLVFGSYTCPIYRRQMPEFNRIYEQFKDRFTFLNIYLNEAHPRSTLFITIDGQRTLRTIDQTFDMPTRNQLARGTIESLSLTIPTVVDNIDLQARWGYWAWPIRFMIVEPGGKVVLKSVNGIDGFWPTDLEDWLKQNVSP